MKRAKKIFALIILAVMLSVSCIMMGACNNSDINVKRISDDCYMYNGVNYTYRGPDMYQYETCQMKGNEVGYARDKYGLKISAYFMASDEEQNILMFKNSKFTELFYVKEGFDIFDVLNTPINKCVLQEGSPYTIECKEFIFWDIVEECEDEFSSEVVDITWDWFYFSSYPYLRYKIYMFERDNDIYVVPARYGKKYYKVVDEYYKEIFLDALALQSTN